MFEVHDRITEVAKRYLRNMRKTGAENVIATCPFHRKADGSYESHPSFTLSIITGLWQCHSCKERGTLQRLLLLIGDGYQTVSLYEDLFEELRKQRPQRANAHLSSNYLTDEPLPEATLGFFDTCPLPLLDEGFEEETLKRFEVGYDAKHHRITFPIRDMDGFLMGVSGRTVLDENPRHKVYDYEFEAYGLGKKKPARKSASLWNGHTLYASLFPTFNPDPVVVVEGFKACMWLWQAGITNVVALMGSNLSMAQKWLLERMGGPTYLMLDNDKAGINARKEIGATLAKSLPLHMVDYSPDYRQPSDVPPEDLLPYLNNAENYYCWATKKLLGDDKWHSVKTQTT